MPRIDVAIVSTDAALATEAHAWFPEERYRAFQVPSAADALGLFDADAAARLVFAVFSSLPSAAQVQGLLDVGQRTEVTVLCGLRAPIGAPETNGLLTVGLQEVVPLLSIDGGVIDAVVAASLAHDRDRREASRARERALVARDVATAMAGARTPHAICDAFSLGLLALGAGGVACWAATERGIALVTEHGGPIEEGQTTELWLNARHPATAAIRDGVAAWLTAGEARERYPTFRPSAEHLAIAALPLRRRDGASDVVVVAYPAFPADADRHAAEQLCSLLAETLHRAELQGELEAQRDASRRLLALIGQDLTDPLNTIAVGARVLHDSHQDAASASTFIPIELAAQSALRLVENALAFAKSTAGELELSRRDHDVFALLSAAVNDERRLAPGGRRVHLELNSPAATAPVDPVRIAQALRNLLSDALARSPEGSTVVARGASDDHAVYIDVENRRGGGATEISEIIQPMKQLGAAVARGSNGLGLFLADRIVEAHGGRLWGEPVEPDGVRFSLQLPRRTAFRGKEVAIVPASPRSSSVKPEPSVDPDFAELAQRFRDDALTRVLAVWCDARRASSAEPGRMPHPHDLDRRRLLAYLPDMISATVAVGTDGNPLFSWTSIGPRLERRLRGTLGADLNAGDKRHAQYEMYRLCYQRREPTYDYVRDRGPHAYSFERLLLPMSRMQSSGPSDILGLILFSDPLG